jgi:rhamnose transport system ATP-binding protein
MVGAPVVRLSGVRKAFGGVQALQDAALALYPGQITALIGENGAGKSTLVKILTGVLQPDGGAIEIGGARAQIASPLAAQKRGICAVYQESVIFDALSVAENIFMADPPRKNGALDWHAMRARAARLLETLHAPIDPDTPASQLNIGQKQLVQIARALAQDARVVIFDEPTAALSHREAEDLFKIIARLRDEGRAILFISHKFEEVFALCDRYAVFRDGAAVGEGAIADASVNQLISLMVGREMSQMYPAGSAKLGDEVLRVEKLGRRGEFANVSFEVRAGEILGLYGLVGAGRSEVTKALFGLTPPDEGHIVVAGEVRAIAGPAQAMQAGFALVPEDRQHQGLALTLAVGDNIALASLTQDSRLGFIDASKQHARIAALAQRLDIKTPGLDAPAQALSGGNQQKIVLAKWLARTPRILLLDEPTKGVDVGAKAAVHQSVRALADSGMAVVMVSSDLPEIMGMADRILVMRRGRVQGIVNRAGADPEAIMRLATDA